MTEPNQNQLWRDLYGESPQTGDRCFTGIGFAYYEPKYADEPWCWQRPVTCNCPALREAVETLMFGAPSACRRSKGELHQPGICGYCDGMKALAATPCTSGGKSEEKLWSDDWHKVIQEVLKCDPIPASKRVDGKLEPPSEVIARIRADRDQWKERADNLTLELDKAYDQVNKLLDSRTWIPLHGPGSRRPTEQDASNDGQIMFRNENGHSWADYWQTHIHRTATHFHTVSKFTPAPDPDTAAFEKWWEGEHPFMHKDGARAAYTAALAHRDAQQKARP